ncbi:uncharacterized protein BDR25DRAFT_357523 [Lindgomyces ingoldianus]|uniref:Uncharacterized protein n=1 Tax=Lindgomyces ingoldianus TaxID=673940 RepID=A0ACB6QQN6_9PLEO|nr:uncharacterized protein BDR25DRAFT_357523 [Lindgomyces ingoldianus]KAF2468597.1 hypothetical protein BDR25DRAFT_357523 [Lindgomyces ingoldianus]
MTFSILERIPPILGHPVLRLQDIRMAPFTWRHVAPMRERRVPIWNIIRATDTMLGQELLLSRASGLTIGPPLRLKSIFLHSDFFRDRKHVSLPVYGGLCHAKHIYNDENVQTIVQTSSTEALNSELSPRIPIFSTSTGRPFLVNNVRGIFEAIISEILTPKIEWNGVVQGVVQRVSEIAASECEVLVFRISLPVHDLISFFQVELPGLEARTQELVPWISDKNNDGWGPRGFAQPKIVIVGMSCRMPGGGKDTEKFWDLLEQELDSHFDPTGKRVNANHTPYGCFIDEPGLFDAPFFNMSPREAQQTDPMQRIALVTAYEALERAGCVANQTAATNLHRIRTTYFNPGGSRALGPGRINYFFKFSGPSFSIDTACSSSLATIQAAFTSLWNGACDTVVAGGMNVLTNSDAFNGLSHSHFLSKTPSECKTWDCEADRYCRADGIGSIVMKRLKDAEADNNNILSIILEARTNHSPDAISIAHPHAGAQSYLERKVLSYAGVDPLDVSFVEMYGTGTQAGHHEELQSVSDVFAPAVRRRSQKYPLYIGTVKANVGHGGTVTGVTALLKVLLVFQKSLIPPHVGIRNSINPEFPKDLNKRNLRIPYEKQHWPRVSGRKRIAFVNNLSAAGGNTSIAIQEGPIRDVNQIDPRTTHVIAVSAKKHMIGYLDANSDISLSNLFYSTTARRHHHNHRVAVAASEVTQITKQLTSDLHSVNSHKPIPTARPPSVAFAFIDQGSSYKFSRSRSRPSERACTFTSVTQLALVCVEIALTKYWTSLGVKPNVVIGHSLGEYTALHVAGMLSASDAIFLVGQRAKMLEENCKIGSHKMMAVRASLNETDQNAGERPYEVACINGPKETVLSGTVEQIDALVEPLQADGYECFSLDIPFAFHSSQTDPILDDFEDVAKSGVHFHAPNMPVITPLLSKVIFDDKTVNASYLRRATREPVNFLAALEIAQRIGTIDDATTWVEIGPHPVCMGFVKATLPSVNISIPSIRRGKNNWVTIAQSLGALHCAGVQLGWSEFHRPFEGELRLLGLPTYALTKGDDFYDAEKGLTQKALVPASHSSLRTSTVQQIVEETFQGLAGKVVMQGDLIQPDFLAAAHGHKMNGCGVITSLDLHFGRSIHADIAFTLGEYLYKKLMPNVKDVAMNVANLEVLKGIVAKDNTKTPQVIQVSAATPDIHSGLVHLRANLYYGDTSEWLASWVLITHLVQSRIEAIQRLAEGVADRFSRNMAYRLFANSLVDYAGKYRGMQSAVLHELEAFADMYPARSILKRTSASRLVGAQCVLPAHSLLETSTASIKMIPAAEDPAIYLGDAYILPDGVIIGMVGGIKFRRYPRLLLDRFFSAPDEQAPKRGVAPASKPTLAQAEVATEATLVPTPVPAPALVPTAAAIVFNGVESNRNVKLGNGEGFDDEVEVVAFGEVLVSTDGSFDGFDTKCGGRPDISSLTILIRVGTEIYMTRSARMRHINEHRNSISDIRLPISIVYRWRQVPMPECVHKHKHSTLLLQEYSSQSDSTPGISRVIPLPLFFESNAFSPSLNPDSRIESHWVDTALRGEDAWSNRGPGRESINKIPDHSLPLRMIYSRRYSDVAFAVKPEDHVTPSPQRVGYCGAEAMPRNFNLRHRRDYLNYIRGVEIQGIFFIHPHRLQIRWSNWVSHCCKLPREINLRPLGGHFKKFIPVLVQTAQVEMLNACIASRKIQGVQIQIIGLLHVAVTGILISRLLTAVSWILFLSQYRYQCPDLEQEEEPRNMNHANLLSTFIELLRRRQLNTRMSIPFPKQKRASNVLSLTRQAFSKAKKELECSHRNSRWSKKGGSNKDFHSNAFFPASASP